MSVVGPARNAPDAGSSTAPRCNIPALQDTNTRDPSVSANTEVAVIPSATAGVILTPGAERMRATFPWGLAMTNVRRSGTGTVSAATPNAIGPRGELPNVYGVASRDDPSCAFRRCPSSTQVDPVPEWQSRTKQRSELQARAGGASRLALFGSAGRRGSSVPSAWRI